MDFTRYYLFARLQISIYFSIFIGNTSRQTNNPQKMKVNLIVAILVLAAVSGCKNKSAFNYSEKIVKLERDMGPDIEKADERMAKYLETQTYDSVINISTRMEGLVDSKLDIIRNTEAPSVAQGEDFKKASIRYFTYFKNMYKAYRNYASQVDEEGRENARQQLVDLASQGEKEVKEMQTAQKKYADANNFKIRKEVK